MPRKSNTAARRAQIIDAMLTVMAASGYEGASIQAIARQAGLTPGLLHYHFGSKAEILLGTLEHMEARLRARYARRMRASSSPEEALSAWIDAHLALDDDADPRLVACFVQLSATALTMPDIHDRYAALLSTDAAHLSELLTPLAPDPKQRAPIVAALMAAVTGAWQLSLSAPHLTPPGSAASMVKRMSVGLLQLR